MNEELILERLNELPDNLQLQVLDYIEFLINRYSEKIDSELEEYENEEISSELKTLLEERLAEYRKNPQEVVSWDEVKAKFNKKHGYAV